MDIDMLQGLLGWCALVNMAVLTLWFVMIIFARDAVFRLHSRWFRVSRAHFEAIHYAGIAAYKIAIYLLFIVPWLALLIVRS